ncbi:flagellar biosynthetic protein FliO [Pararhodospirillum oryzae]|uniref:Flagellar protein n=1 Tax=Pararhodospirillum oryzae TaxID=478448 RepID=A0A512H4C0_9PROT|nr:flagellar biosynthetic protein FliO [Pararhodospirillum oryzae]GEO80302.1 flagellar protein [Pararhodospirillum oryzae]
MDLDHSARFFLVLIFVLGLIFLLAFLVRRFGPGLTGRWRPGRRLSVVEVMAVDPKRRLVLIRRDDTEHLLLIGGTTDVVIETLGPRLPESIPPPGEASASFARHLAAAVPDSPLPSSPVREASP